MLVSTNAHFLEEDYMVDNKPRSKVVLDELRKEGEVSTVLGAQIDPPRVTDTQEQKEPRRSRRVVQQPDRFISLGEVIEEPKMDPCNYNKVIQDKDATLWLKAMNTKMESMYSNQVWSLVDASDGVKPIGCKWIYKRKRGVNGKVETFKARLVAKGYT